MNTAEKIPYHDISKEKWVGEDYILAWLGITKKALQRYRHEAWLLGVHYRKIGATGQASARGNSKIVYCKPEIQKWIESYPQH
ncbi:TPA: excisionase family protein [Vibrio cholerae]|uniref:excisionase family protein n=1 Tax=Vibrio TaxID=662 RepID=UPI0000EF9A93|nr:MULTISPECIES: excisionase family protein [Vibrio]ATD27040.1 hypothetical protein FORC55_1056 [Vibrio cholerae]EGR2105396.1 hypothetical protein [Vibrio cholerae]EGR2446766.1 hypothetical protein [Vibrio cholerae]EGR4280994.1 hypothetical protein [Vibrio cholerae]EJL6757195.1 excisionase family protein [Vibrio cholerae]